MIYPSWRLAHIGDVVTLPEGTSKLVAIGHDCLGTPMYRFELHSGATVTYTHTDLAAIITDNGETLAPLTQKNARKAYARLRQRQSQYRGTRSSNSAYVELHEDYQDLCALVERWIERLPCTPVPTETVPTPADDSGTGQNYTTSASNILKGD